MKEMTTSYPAIWIVLGTLLALLAEKERDTIAEKQADRRPGTKAGPSKDYFDRLIERFDNTLERLRQEAANCPSGDRQDTAGEFPFFRNDNLPAHNYRGYYGI